MPMNKGIQKMSGRVEVEFGCFNKVEDFSNPTVQSNCPIQYPYNWIGQILLPHPVVGTHPRCTGVPINSLTIGLNLFIYSIFSVKIVRGTFSKGILFIPLPQTNKMSGYEPNPFHL
jgi:hypothetical protein